MGKRGPCLDGHAAVPFLYGLVFSWVGEARVYIQALNSCLFALTVLLTYLLGKRLWDEETDCTQVSSSWESRTSSRGAPAARRRSHHVFLTLSIFCFLRAAEQGGLAWTAGSALAICAALFSKYSTWPMLSLIPAMAVVLMRQDPKKIFIHTFAVLLMAGVLAGAIILLRLDLFQEQITLLRTYQWSGLSRWQEGYLSTFLFQVHPFITGLALFGTYRAAREKDTRFLVAGWFVVIVLLLQIKRIRYIIPLFPLFALMASHGLNEIRTRA
jgi:hypothetical protein